nr:MULTISPECIES: hypothetical protein [unclassified Rhizobium]
MNGCPRLDPHIGRYLGACFGLSKATVLRQTRRIAQFNVNLLVERPGQVRDRTKRKLSLPAKVAVQLLSADTHLLCELLLRKARLGSPFDGGGNEIAANVCDEAAGRTRTRAYLKPK